MVYRFLALVMILFLYTGCAPRYVVKHEYIPPMQQNAQTCLDQCAFSKQECQARCQQERQYCLEDAYGRARAIEQAELRSYDMAYLRYQMDFNQFQHHLHMWERDYRAYERDFYHFQSRCERERDTSACRQRDEIKRRMNHLRTKRPQEPWVPVRPSFEQILIDQQRVCPVECGCQASYDSCFVGCGGTVIPHKICVENCD